MCIRDAVSAAHLLAGITGAPSSPHAPRKMTVRGEDKPALEN